jgi:hypothetical protein
MKEWMDGWMALRSNTVAQQTRNTTHIVAKKKKGNADKAIVQSLSVKAQQRSSRGGNEHSEYAHITRSYDA